MISVTVDWIRVSVQCDEPLVSGGVNVQSVQFSFSSDWNSLDRIAVFRCSGVCRSVLLENDNTALIPWECMAEENAGWPVMVGVRGLSGSETVLATVMAPIGMLRHGAVDADPSSTPTPSLFEQYLDQVRDLLGCGSATSCVLNQADQSPLQFWAGTQEEHDAISEPESNTLYFVTGDDTS